jgi:hypothetical protein
MTALVWVATNLRAILASHVALQLMDRCHLRPANNVQRHRLMGVAAEAFYFQIEITSVERVAQRWGGLGRSLKAEHSLVPSLAGEPVSLFARFRCPFRRCSDRAAIDRFSRLGAHGAKNAAGQPESASRYGLWIAVGSALGTGG